jgi:hypothetical protein
MKGVDCHSSESNHSTHEQVVGGGGCILGVHFCGFFITGINGNETGRKRLQEAEEGVQF